EYKGDFGSDVPGWADEFQYCWQPWTGEGEMVARVVSLAGSSTGHAGIMVRVGTDAGAYNVFCDATAAGGVGAMSRPGTLQNGYDATNYRRQTFPNYSASGVPTPLWLKLVRVTDGVMCYSSADGSAWQELAWVDTPLTSTVQFGMAVSSQNDGPPASVLTATFDHVRIGAITTPIAPPAPPSNLHLVQIFQTSLELDWTVASSTIDSLQIERSTDGTNFAVVITNPNHPWTENSLTPDTTYYFRARTQRDGVYSAYTPVVTAHTTAYAQPPSNLSGTSSTPTSVNLTWTDNSANETSF